MLVFILRQFELFERGQRLAERLLSGEKGLARLLPDDAGLDADIRALNGQGGRLAASVAWQFAGMVAGGLADCRIQRSASIEKQHLTCQNQQT